jgi:hypothetical protein
VKISYAIPGGAYTVLVDESLGTDGFVTDWTPKASALLQEEPIYGAAAQYRSPLANKAARWTLAFDRVYASRAAAMAATRTIQGLLGTKYHIKIEEPSTTPTETHYYPNAVFAGYSGEVQGCSCVHVLEATSDICTDSAPS